MADQDLAYQFSGPYVQTFMQAVQEHMHDYDVISAYFYGLAIDTALADELAFIGLIVGYPWPAAPLGIFGDNNFVFGQASGFPVIDNLTGFGSLDGLVGGQFTSANPAVGNLIPLAQYQILLTQVAYLKAHGLTLKAIDQICFSFGPEYTINNAEFDDDLLILSEAADYPQYSSTTGLSGVDPIYDDQGGRLWTTGPDTFSDADIFIVFQTDIGPGNLWLIQRIFDKFTTAPQVFVSQE